MTTISVKSKRERRKELQPLCTKPPAKSYFRSIERYIIPLLVLVVLLVIFLTVPGKENNAQTLVLDNENPNYSDLIIPHDNAGGLVQTADGGFVLAINMESYVEGYTLPSSLHEIILLKINENGTVQWSRTIGGIPQIMTGTVSALIQTTDKGFALAGHTSSLENGNVDAWLVKTDENGMITWNQTYGGVGNDQVKSIVQTVDGGYALAGSTNSYPTVGDNDTWLVKTDENGVMEWNNTYDIYTFGYNDWANDLVQTNDGGFALTGESSELEGETEPFLLKTSGTGTMLWLRSYEDTQGPFSLVQTLDGELVLAGSDLVIRTDEIGTEKWRNSYNGDLYDIIRTDGGFALVGCHWEGSWGILLLNIDHFGSIKWEQFYSSEEAHVDSRRVSLVQTADGGFAMVRSVRLYDPRMPQVAWLVKTDEAGTMVWSRVYTGAMNEEWANDLVQTGDGGYAIAGYTTSQGAGKTDILLVKTDENGIEEWNTTYGGPEDEVANVLVQTTDGGLALAGGCITLNETWDDPNWQPWLVKTDENGMMQWNKTYSNELGGTVTHLVQTTDDGFALVIGDGGWRNGLLKTDKYGEEEWTWRPGWEIHINDVARAADGGVVLTGSVGYWKYLEYQYNITLSKIDTTGKVQWNKVEIIKDKDGTFECALIETNDNGFALIVAGITEIQGKSVNQSSYLLKTDENGVEQWRSGYNGLFMADHNVILVQAADGGFRIAGLAYIYEVPESWGELQYHRTAWAYQSIITDANGAVERFISANDTREEITAMIATADGGFAAGGNWLSYNTEGISFDFFLVKADENGTETWRQTYGKTSDRLNSWHLSTVTREKTQLAQELVKLLFNCVITPLIGSIIIIYPLWIGITAVVSWVWSGKKPVTQIDFKRSADIIICSSCRFVNRPNSTSCSHCGDEFKAIDEDQVQDRKHDIFTIRTVILHLIILLVWGPALFLAIPSYIMSVDAISKFVSQYPVSIILSSVFTLLSGVVIGRIFLSRWRMFNEGQEEIKEGKK